MAARDYLPFDAVEIEDMAAVSRRRYERAVAAHEELENEADAVIDGYIIRLRRTWHEVEACKHDYEARLAEAQGQRLLPATTSFEETQDA